MNSSTATLLVVDDDEGVRKQYRWLLSDYKVVAAANRADALKLFGQYEPEVAIVDLGLPPDPDGATEGLATVDLILRARPETKIIVVTGNENRQFALSAVAAGAYDFFKKPVDPDVLKLIVERALGVHELEKENRRLIEAMPSSPVAGIIGASPQIRKILNQAERIAKTDIAVLLLGESGSGKELVAQAIHRQSPRAEKPFTALNCAAIPEGLLEAELFGHEKGAFTGAIKRTIGKIESANKGTLFLDEIGDIPLSMQVKLLRFLEDQIIERVGGREQIKIDARIVCATNQDLQKLISDGRFREDLFYRIAEVTLNLPPLRERDGDVILLARYFLKKYAAEFGRAFTGFTADAVLALRDYHWPGNVRELENRIKRGVTMSDGPRVNSEDLQLSPPEERSQMQLREVRRRAERDAVETALAQTGGNISQAAKLLEVSRPKLYDLMRDLAIEVRAQDTVDDDNEQVSA